MSAPLSKLDALRAQLPTRNLLNTQGVLLLHFVGGLLSPESPERCSLSTRDPVLVTCMYLVSTWEDPTLEVPGAVVDDGGLVNRDAELRMSCSMHLIQLNVYVRKQHGGNCSS